MKKKFWAIVAMMLAVTAVMPQRVYAASATTPKTVTVSQAEERIQELIDEFENTFFTVNQINCDYGPHNGNKEEQQQCKPEGNGNVANVIKQDWFKNKMKEMGMTAPSASNLPFHYTINGYKNVLGDECCGFANFAMWYIFAQKGTDKVEAEKITSQKVAATYENMKKALPGDVIQTNIYGWHSMILVSYDSKGFTVLDCNYKSGTGKTENNKTSKVKVHTVSYSKNCVMMITGAKNYDRGEYSSSGTTVTTQACDEYWRINDAQGVYLRKGAGLSNASYCVMPNKTQLHVTKKTTSKVNGYTWGYAKYKNYSGWFAMELADRYYLDQTITTAADEFNGKKGSSDTVNLNAKASGGGALSYSSSNEKVVKVDEKGNLTYVGAGTATIQIKAESTSAYKQASKTVKVTVSEQVKQIQEITVSATEYTKTIGDSAFALNAKTNGDGGLTYESADIGVAVVDQKGLVSLVGEGSTTITITAAGTDTYMPASQTISLLVQPAPEPEEEKKAVQVSIGSEELLPGETVRIPVILEENPGVSVVSVKISYDANAMTLKQVQNGEVFAEGEMVEANTGANPTVVMFVCNAMEDNSQSGIIAYLEFQVSEKAAEGEHPVSIESVLLSNLAEERIECETRNGTLTVISYVSGDMNEDGAVDGLDLIRLKKHLAGWEVEINEKAADMNGDGAVDGLDLIRLKKYLAGWEVELQ